MTRLHNGYFFDSMLALTLIWCSSVHAQVTTTGVYDAATNANTVDSSETTDAGNEISLGTFTTSVMTAFNDDLGGVIDFDNGSISNFSIQAIYGVSAANSITIENGSGTQWNQGAGSNRTQISGAVSPVMLGKSGGGLPNDEDHIFNFDLGERVVAAGATVLGRSGGSDVNYDVTAFFSDGTSSSISFASEGNSGDGTDDSFAGFEAPAGTYIKQLRFDNTGGNFRSVDDLGFIVESAVTRIAGTSFENEFGDGGSGDDYADPAATTSVPDGTVVDIVNQASPQIIVDSTASSTLAGDLGFNSLWRDDSALGSGSSGDGMADGDDAGVVTTTDSSGSFNEGPPAYTDGVQGFAFDDPDGTHILQFDRVNLSQFVDVTVDLDAFLVETSWEGDEFFNIYVETDVGDFTIFDTTGNDLDTLAGVIEGEWVNYGTAIPDSATYADLFVEFQSGAGAEEFFIDDVQFTGTAVAIPEPASILTWSLLGALAVGVAVRRQRRIRS